jgi:outer membrane protein assembly factor BamB
MAVDLTTQKPSWTFQTDASKEFGPKYTLPNGKPNYNAAFFDFYYDDMIIGVDKMLAVGAILSSPVIVNNVIYVGSADGNLYALE